jgi:hypothetical protein
MFEKHTTTLPTGQIYEAKSKTGYYRIFEVENGRYIDADKYVPYIQWKGTPVSVNMNPTIIDTPVSDPVPTLEDRIKAIETKLNI